MRVTLPGISRLSIRSRLLIILLLISSVSVLVVGALAYRSAQRTIQERIFSQLTGLRASRAYQLETYLGSIRNQLVTLSSDFTVLSAMSRFATAFERFESGLDGTRLDLRQKRTLAQFYETEFLPRLRETAGGNPVASTYLPGDSYLQYYYLATNPFPVGEKNELVQAGDGSSYSVVHSVYQETFDNLVETYDYYDLFLIDHASGNVVYSVFKEVDFATNLYTGPYRNSNLAEVVRRVRDAPDPGVVYVADFDFYTPSYNAPAAFAATAVYRGTDFIGILAVQFPVDEINRIMTGGAQWRRDGLGETGTTYLVGDDFLMRSASRAFAETPEAYLATLEGIGVPSDTRGLIASFGTPILLQRIDTEVARDALRAQEGTRIARDYRGEPVLSSFAPLDLPGLRWAILAEIDLAEAYEPLYDFRRLLILSVGGLLLLITLLAMIIANVFTRPINAFIRDAEKIASGRTETIQVKSQDEFAQLASSLNSMVDNLREETRQEREKSQQSEMLLYNLLPARVTERLLDGETQIVDRYPNVTVMHIDLFGFTELSTSRDLSEATALLNELVSLFDEAAEAHGVEKVKTMGANYLAVCGVSVPRLDHAKRTVDFAQELLRRVQFFNSQHDLELSLAAGIASGSVVAGIVGLRNFIYDLWGEPVDSATLLSQEAGAVFVSVETANRLDDVFRFEVQPHSDLGEVYRLVERSQTALRSGA